MARKFQKPESFEGVENDDLRKLADEAIAEARAIIEADDDKITDEALADAEALMAEAAEIEAEIAVRDEAAAAKAERLAALRATKTPEATAEEEPEDETEPEAEAEVEVEAEEKVKEVVTAAASKGVVRKVAAKAPEVVDTPPAKSVGVIVASANVPGIDTGSELVDMEALANAFIARSRSFNGRPTPEGSEIFERYGVANIRRPENEFTITGRMSSEDAMDIINSVVKQNRLPGGSLVAAGGWCAPSNTLYDFCENEVVDGLLSLPEVTLTHGGVNFTKGPDLASLIANANFGWKQTEAQAIAGTAKPVFDITCPPFTDVRLEAVGYAIRAGILTASPAGWPELVRRFLNLAVMAHQYKMNSDSLSRLSTAIGAAVDFVELGSATADILDAIAIQANIIRETQFLAVDATIEVVLPLWAPDIIRADLARRGGDLSYLQLTNQQVVSLFTARNLAPQFVRGYQPQATTGTAFPTTLEAMLYPAGSYVLGVNDVISLDTVYDSPLLTTNTYTAVFFEEARVLFNPCGTGRKVAIATTDIHGRVGEASLPGVATLT